MSLRKFLSEAPYVCTKDEVLASRIAKQMLLMYDYELKNTESEYAMKTEDFTNPLGRIELMFTWKYLEGVDLKKAQRVEDLVYLLSLYSYKNKYSSVELTASVRSNPDLSYSTQIATMESTIDRNPVKEVDSLMSSEYITAGYWSN